MQPPKKYTTLFQRARSFAFTFYSQSLVDERVKQLDEIISEGTDDCIRLLLRCDISSPESVMRAVNMFYEGALDGEAPVQQAPSSPAASIRPASSIPEDFGEITSDDSGPDVDFLGLRGFFNMLGGGPGSDSSDTDEHDRGPSTPRLVNTIKLKEWSQHSIFLHLGDVP